MFWFYSVFLSQSLLPLFKLKMSLKSLLPWLFWLLLLNWLANGSCMPDEPPAAPDEELPKLSNGLLPLADDYILEVPPALFWTPRLNLVGSMDINPERSLFCVCCFYSSYFFLRNSGILFMPPLLPPILGGGTPPPYIWFWVLPIGL